MLRVWNLSLLLATFSLTILGTFLTRSRRARLGARVHRVAHRPGDPRRSSRSSWPSASASSAGGATGCARRAPSTRRCPREGAFLANNVLFAAFAFVVLLGTVFPLIVEALERRPHLGRAAVLRPHDDADRLRAAVPHGGGAGAAVAQGVAASCCGTGCSGRRGPARSSWSCSRGARACGAWRRCSPSASAAFAAGAAVRQLVLSARRQGWRGLVGRANGGMVVHLGVVSSPSPSRPARRTRQPGASSGWRRASRRRSAGTRVTYLGTPTRAPRQPHARSRPTCASTAAQVYRPVAQHRSRSPPRPSARRRCAPGSPRTCTSRCVVAPTTPAATAVIGVIVAAAGPVAVDRRRDHGPRHPARPLVPRAAPARRPLPVERRRRPRRSGAGLRAHVKRAPHRPLDRR